MVCVQHACIWHVSLQSQTHYWLLVGTQGILSLGDYHAHKLFQLTDGGHALSSCCDLMPCALQEQLPVPLNCVVRFDYPLWVLNLGTSAPCFSGACQCTAAVRLCCAVASSSAAAAAVVRILCRVPYICMVQLQKDSWE